ncbi:MAG: twin-arginine translocation signal domain-containing protein [Planctomycetota bacterium]|jgi:D-lyxose ketol-isomerase
MSDGISRRDALKGAAAGAALVGLSQAGCKGTDAPAPAAKAKPNIKFDNAFFYGADGAFDKEKAKDAYIALMKYHGYSLADKARANLWVCDYGLGQFTKLGLGAWMFKNNVKDRYMLMDVYLLPNQMLPEHWHVAGEGKDAGNPAKLEGWLIRHGLSHVVGEGDKNLPPEVVIPKCHMGGTATVWHDTVAAPGTFVPLVRVESRHWQFAGPEGAILTEVANVHTGSAVGHSDPAADKHFKTKEQ